MEEVDIGDMKDFLKKLYDPETKIGKHNAPALLYLVSSRSQFDGSFKFEGQTRHNHCPQADRYGVEWLKWEAETRLLNRINAGGVCDVARLADRHNSHRLFAACENYLVGSDQFIRSQECLSS